MWSELFNVLYYLAPVFVVALVVAGLCYLVFIVALPKLVARRVEEATKALSVGDAALASQPADPIELTGFVSWPVFVFMTAILGAVTGVLLSLLGGIAAPVKEAADGATTSDVSLLGTTLSLVVAAAAAAVTLFGDNDKVGLRRPLGAIAFLLCMLICGLYWSAAGAA